MRPIVLSFCVAFLPVGQSLAEGELSVGEARDHLQKWVETRQLTSQLQTDWRSEKEMLESTVDLFNKELSDLTAQLEKADTDTSQVGKERTALEAERAELEAAEARVGEWATQLEARVRELAKAFPPPLSDKLDALLVRMPVDPANTRLNPIERMQTLVGILNEVDKFNSSIAVESELQKRPSGEEIQVKTLYVGLGQAYFVDQTGDFAGIGVPSAEGWEWKEAPELANEILHAIAVYENVQPPSFDNLPMTLN
jgi:septal ring factor EnvC (AmiA/AmiB activator)